MDTAHGHNIDNLLVFLQQGGEEEKKLLAGSLREEEWNRLIETARNHRLTPYLYVQLSKTGFPVPEKSLTLLKNDHLRTAARNIRLYRSLEQILKKLDEENIQVILLKGIHLAEAVYDNIGMRPMTDMDLLIPPGEIKQAIQALEEIGFIAERPFWSDVDGELHMHAPTMMKDGFFIELHWSLTREMNLTSFNLDELWERAQPYKFGVFQVKVLHLTDLILHLALHAAYGHQFHEQLLSLVDIKEIITKHSKDIDWLTLEKRCKDWKAEKGFYLVMRLVCDSFHVPLPDQFMENLEPADWNESTLTWVKQRVFQKGQPLSENYIQLMEGKTLREKIHGLIRGLFPAKNIMAMEYGIPIGSWRILAKYPYHIIAKIKKYWRPFVNRTRGDAGQEYSSKGDKELREWLGVG